MAKVAKKEVVKSKEVEAYMAKKLRPQQEALKAPTEKLIINISTTTAAGKKIAEHIGKFNVMGTELYSDVIKFRPLAAVNKLIKMSKGKDKDGKEKWNYLNETIFFTSYSEPIYDAKGGFACGKIFGAKRANLNAKMTEENNSKGKSFLYLFGLAQFPNDKGKFEDDADWHFVDFRVGGKRIMIASDAFGYKTIGKNHVMSEFIYTMSLLPVNGSVHPNLEIDVDTDDVHDVSNIIDYDTKIVEYIDAHNDRVIASHKKYNQQNTINAEDDDTLDSLNIGEDDE